MHIAKNRTIVLLLAAFAVSVYLMIWWTVAGTIAAILVLLLTIDTFLLGSRFTKGIYRKVGIRHPFDVWFVPNPGVEITKSAACSIHKSQMGQNLCFTVFMRQELSLQTIRLEFLPNTELGRPMIDSLFDWYNVKQTIPQGVMVNQMIDGAWYWEYAAAKLRYKKSQTTVGIKCLAANKFQGVLRFTATFNEDVRKVYDVPFVVED